MAAVVRYYDMVSGTDKAAVDHHLRMLDDARQTAAPFRAASAGVRGVEDFSPLHDPHAEQERISKRFIDDEKFRGELLDNYRNRISPTQPSAETGEFIGHGGVPSLRQQLRGFDGHFTPR